MAKIRQVLRWMAVVTTSATLPLAAHGAVTNVTGQVVLAEDADWRGFGLVSMAEGASIDLAGHALKVDGVAQTAVQLVDATSSAGAVTATAVYSGAAEFLFDDHFVYTSNTSATGNTNANHRVCVNNVFPFDVTYDFGEGNETCIRSYKIYYDSLMHSNVRAPKSWTFSGSNDNENWTILDARSNVTDWAQPDARTFSFGNLTSYRYYRLSVSSVVSGNVLELYQLEYFTVPTEPGDVTVPDPDRVTSSALYSGHASFLFDNQFRYAFDANDKTNTNKNHRVCVTTMPFDVVYDFGADNEPALNGYKIYFNSCSGGSEQNIRAPFDWQFQGSNDNMNWTPLDIREGVTNWTKPCVREFWFANGTPWRYYRLHVTKHGPDSCLELYHLEYFSKPTILSKSGVAGTDLTEPGNEHLTLSSAPMYGSVSHLFDNNFSYRYDSSHVNDHRILVAKSGLPFNIVYDFGADVRTNVTAYKIYYQSAANNTNRAPRAWAFAGSNDGSAWTTLDIREKVMDWTQPPCSLTCSFVNPHDYRYYRLQLTDTFDTYLEMYQLEFFHGQTGELHVEVPAGTAQTNRYISLDGALRVVKDGAGSFTAACANQTYHGGTVVSNGTLVAGLAGDAAPLGNPNDTSDESSAVAVCAGGTFDVNGLGGWWRYPVLLSGGTLACAMPTNAAPEDTFRNIMLNADSRLAVGGNFVMGDGTGTAGLLDLGDHKLTASIAGDGLWTLDVPSITAGTIAFDLAKGDAYSGKKVMAWESGSRPAGVLFTRAGSGYYGVTAQDDGVYAISGGIMVIIR